MATRISGAKRDAPGLPFTARELSYWEVVTPQMSNWLPKAERAAVCAEFSAHLARLSRAPA
jgi:hypothetical protein